MNPDPTASRTAHLFVYGTLMFDEVVSALTDRTFRTRPATLRGFARHAVLRDGRRQAYPAIWRQPSGVVAGRLLLDVDERSMRLIDYYENDPPDYERMSVVVKCDGDQSLQATTYVALSSTHPFLADDWHGQQFERVHLTKYVQEVIPQLVRQFALARISRQRSDALKVY